MVKEDEIGRACGMNGEKIKVSRLLVGKPEVRRPLRRLRLRWVDSINIYVREKGWGGMDWIDLAQDRYQWKVLLNTVMNFQVP
jgi:hypothetical protein